MTSVHPCSPVPLPSILVSAFLKCFSPLFNSSHAYHSRLPLHHSSRHTDTTSKRWEHPLTSLSGGSGKKTTLGVWAEVPAEPLACCAPQGKSPCLSDSQISIQEKGMITMHRGILKLKDILCGPGIESAISIHVLPPGWRKFVAVLTQPSPGSFELQGPFPFPQPQFHVLSCLPAPTHIQLHSVHTP